MRYFFLIIFFSLSFYPQSINEDTIKKLEELEKLGANLQNNNFINEGVEQQDLETLRDNNLQETVNSNNDQLVTPESEISKFGYDFFNKVPTSVSATQDLPVPNDYKISLKDRVKIIFSGSIDKTYELEVSLDGSLLIPELGEIQAVGISLSEFRNTLRNLVEASYVGASIDLNLTELSSKKISIIGAVNVPGTYLVNPFTTITGAIAYAGGIKDYGSLRNIKLKRGQQVKDFDLYDFLIFGNRQDDEILQAGDTVLVSGTDSFVEIVGQVIRPGIYEYSANDTYEELLSFALGLKTNAETNNIYVVDQIDQNLRSRRLDNTANIVSKNKPVKLFAGKSINDENIGIFVEGSEVSGGYLDPNDFNSFAELISSLNFSKDIYPFFVSYEINDPSNFKNKIINFSLFDEDSYAKLKPELNSKIRFFSKSEILDGTANYIGTDRIDFKSINIGTKSYNLPIVGKISPSSIYEYIGEQTYLLKNKVAVINDGELEQNVYENLYDSGSISNINFPYNEKIYITVEIDGNINSPGAYNVLPGTTLKDLYEISGGLREGSSYAGILLSRESIKIRERQYLKLAKNVLAETAFLNSANSNTNSMMDFQGMIDLVDTIDVTGRLSGDLSPDSKFSSTVVLEDGDFLYIPTAPTSISVLGEALNPSTVLYDPTKSVYEYIDLAGGFTEYADKNSVYVIRENGMSIPVNNRAFSRELLLYPGDTIIIPKDYAKLDVVPLIATVTKIISDIAFSAASLNAIRQ